VPLKVPKLWIFKFRIFITTFSDKNKNKNKNFKKGRNLAKGSIASCSPPPAVTPQVQASVSFLAEELAVEQKNEEIDVDLSSIKHFHQSNTFVLQLQQVLQ